MKINAQIILITLLMTCFVFHCKRPEATDNKGVSSDTKGVSSDKSAQSLKQLWKSFKNNSKGTIILSCGELEGQDGNLQLNPGRGGMDCKIKKDEIVANIITITGHTDYYGQETDKGRMHESRDTWKCTLTRQNILDSLKSKIITVKCKTTGTQKINKPLNM